MLYCQLFQDTTTRGVACMQGSVWERIAAGGARLAWPVARALATTIPSRTFQPAWAPAPLTKSGDRSKPALGWPRITDSLCPTCVKHARRRILDGEQDIATLTTEHAGEIKAHIFEHDGQIVVEKTCPEHGTFTDVLAMDPAFLARIEGLFPGRDFQAVTDRLHNHGASSIKYGRGAVLTVDLTNRCNMMCDPCFMDANQVGFVHELSFDDIKEILDNAITIKPRRQMSVQFSGGEPTISPYFIDSIKYARKVG